MSPRIALAAAALLGGCELVAPAYPEFGEAAYRIEGVSITPGVRGMTRSVIYRDGQKMRVETVLPNFGRAVVVFDQATNAAYVLDPSGRAPAAPPPLGAAPAEPPLMEGPRANEPSAVPAMPPSSGIAVRIDDMEAPQPLETAWAALGAENARFVGNCRVAGERGGLWRPREEPARGVQRTACITPDGIVLRVEENEHVLWQATALERGPQSASLFGVPTGYRVLEPRAVASALPDSVIGAPPEPQEAPPPRG
jgi:hypothetical protein